MSVDETPVSEPTSAPARSRAATRARLVEAATALFSEEGLEDVTSARIARRAGVATGTFYLHFKDKSEIFRGILQSVLADLRGRVQAAVAAAADEPEAKIRARVEVLVSFAEERADLIRIVFGRDALANLAEDVFDDVIPGVERGLRERARRGGTPEGVHPAVAAQALVAMWTRVIRWWADAPDAAPRDAVIETMTRMHPGSLPKDRN